MLIGKPPDIPSSEITPQEQYLNRRRFMRKTFATTVAASAAARTVPPTARKTADTDRG